MLMTLFPIQRFPNHTPVAQRILEEIELCSQFLRVFYDSIEEYRKKLNEGKDVPWYMSSWHKIGWTVIKKKDIKDIRSKILRHQQAIECFLTGVGMYVIFVT